MIPLISEEKKQQETAQFYCLEKMEGTMDM